MDAEVLNIFISGGVGVQQIDLVNSFTPNLLMLMSTGRGNFSAGINNNSITMLGFATGMSGVQTRSIGVGSNGN
jgi:hypothetical protein